MLGTSRRTPNQQSKLIRWKSKNLKHPIVTQLWEVYVYRKKYFESRFNITWSHIAGVKLASLTNNNYSRYECDGPIFIEINAIMEIGSLSPAQSYTQRQKTNIFPNDFPDSKFHGANMGPAWVLSAPDGPHVGPMNLAIRVTVRP